MASAAEGISYYYYYGSLLLVLYFTWRYLVQALSKKWSSYGDTRAQLQNPPSPPGLAVIGHLHHLVLGSSSFPQKLLRLATHYGSLLQLHMGASKFILVSDANFATEILKTHELNFLNRPDIGNPKYNIFFGYGMFSAPYGTHWRFLKKLCMTKLLSTSQLNRFIHIREQEVMKLLQYLIKVSIENNFCDLSTPLTTMMNNVVCRTAISTSFSDDADDAKKIKALADELAILGGKLSAGEILGPLKKLDLLGYGRKLKKALYKFDGLIEEIIKEHEDNSITAGKRERDLMDILLETCNDQSAEVKLTRTDIKALLLDMFIAGTESTAKAVEWAMGELINHPQVLKKLRQEILSVVGTDRRLVKESDSQNLPYLQAVVKETLRLHPPSIIFPRQSDEEREIKGFKLQAKSRILFNVYSIMRDPSSWNNPEEFVPERFMTKSDDVVVNSNQDVMGILKGQSLDFIPFGSGRRSCPGASLALTMMHATVGALVQCFDWRVKDGEKVDMREASGFGLALEMANPLLCYPVIHFNLFEQSLK